MSALSTLSGARSCRSFVTLPHSRCMLPSCRLIAQPQAPRPFSLPSPAAAHVPRLVPVSSCAQLQPGDYFEGVEVTAPGVYGKQHAGGKLRIVFKKL